ncbi:MAG: hypothetical protein LQ341_006381, partial [Variospora aurantia]
MVELESGDRVGMKTSAVPAVYGGAKMNEVKDNVNQLPNYQLSVDIHDQDGRLVVAASKQDAAKPHEVDNSALPYNFILATGGLVSDPISFWYADTAVLDEQRYGQATQVQGGQGWKAMKSTSMVSGEWIAALLVPFWKPEKKMPQPVQPSAICFPPRLFRQLQ